MAFETLLALTGFAFVSSITPGPNNVMLMTSGVNFGFRPTIPHMLGITGGFAILLLCVGFGLGALLQAFPVLERALRYVSAAYLVYLAWKIAFSRSIGESEAGARPLGFVEAAAFQWVNPKAWTMALIAMAAYASAEQPVLSILLIAAVFSVVNLPCVSVWAAFGVAVRRFLADPRRLRIFNFLMGLLLLATVVPLFATG